MPVRLTLNDLRIALQTVLTETNIERYDVHEPFVFRLSSDTRAINRGDVFIALSGSNFDGNDFIESAIGKGAFAVIGKVPRDGVPCFAVKDATAALGLIARYVRDKLSAKFIAVTGSVGKTTTKDMAKVFMREYGTVGGTGFNFNNHIGVPVTILEQDADTEYIIIEMGMDHAGEIAYLTDIVKPDVAIITSVYINHMESFNSERDIAEAKSEIFIGMGSNGCAVINRDCNFYDLLAHNARKQGVHKIVTYGTHHDSDIRLLRNGATMSVDAHGRELSYAMPDVGEYVAFNSQALIAMAVALDLDPTAGLKGLANFRLPTGKGEVLNLRLRGDRNVAVVDESYNSGPTAVQANLKRLLTMGGKRHVAILGDMAGLGSYTESAHLSLAPFLESPDCVITVGKFMRRASPAQGIHFDSVSELLERLDALLCDGDTVLIKASRVWQFEKVVQYIKTLCV